MEADQESELEVYTQLEQQMSAVMPTTDAPSPPIMSPITIAPSVTAEPSRVKAFVRIRPMSETELQRDEQQCTHVDELRIHVDAVKRAEVRSLPKPTKSALLLTVALLQRSFDFDGAFDCDSSNQDVYEAVGRPVVRAALNGYNGTLIAYGQTGSGKTHTLTCPDGLLPRIAAAVFDHIQGNPRFNFKVPAAVTVQCNATHAAVHKGVNGLRADISRQSFRSACITR